MSKRTRKRFLPSHLRTTGRLNRHLIRSGGTWLPDGSESIEVRSWKHLARAFGYQSTQPSWYGHCPRSVP
jgi:hypothetical protein